MAAAGVRPGEFPWLADLALPTDDGEWDPAGDLLLPGGELAGVVTPEAFGVVEPALADRYGAGVLEAVGVLTSFGLLTARDVDLSDDIDLDLDGAVDWAAWAGELLGRAADGPVPPAAAEVIAIRDLDLVDPARWPRALEIIATRPALRAALASPARVRLADGRHAAVPSYTAWWLRTHPVLGGHRPADLRTAAADPLLEGLYDDASGIAGRTRCWPGCWPTRRWRGPWASGTRSRDCWPSRVARTSCWAGWPTRPGWWTAPSCGRCGLPWPPRTRRSPRRRRSGPSWVTRWWWLMPATSSCWTAPTCGRWSPAGPWCSPPTAWRWCWPSCWTSRWRRSRCRASSRARASGGQCPGSSPRCSPMPRSPTWRTTSSWSTACRCRGAARTGRCTPRTPAGLACALAWAAGQWSARHLLASLLTGPEDTSRLLAEADLDA